MLGPLTASSKSSWLWRWMPRVLGGQGTKATGSVLQIAHVDDADAVRIAVADIGIASMHHDLDAIATPALVGVADELDVAECHRIHGSPPIAPPLVLSPRRPLSYRGDAEKVARIKQPFPTLSTNSI